MLKVKDLLEDNVKALTGETGLANTVEKGYVCDLLSWAMSHAEAGTAWVTVQRNLNVVAVATLTECACIVLAEGVLPDQDFLDKAVEENIAVLSTAMTAFQFCAALSARF